ncbi:pyrroline-5-carboxylate reductase [Desulfogranum mediterraneum]|uniref:pyrroline-5-carboxylate reductase n=1 Tax=Desulfogranum mediterraneum TaxID=160661 RepID=UPI000407C875|nr:pyrroline-5-carboxylate reductase [Desulfogranum mediterraneum]
MQIPDQTIGLLGGGQMAEALIRGLLAARVVAAEQLVVIDPEPARRAYLEAEYGVTSTDDPAEFAGSCTVVILAVKPQMLSMVAQNYGPLFTEAQLLISIMAGVPIQTLAESFPGVSRVVRVMPNTPALVLEGASALSCNDKTSAADQEICRAIFSAVGLCVEVPESQLDAVTGLSGSGPGYVYTILEGLIDGGVLAGLPRPTAEQLAIQTIYGAARLARESGQNAAQLKAQVTSPGGTTIRGIQVLEQNQIRAALMDAVEAAAARSRELGG